MPSWLPSNLLKRSFTLSFCWSTQPLKRFLQLSKLNDRASAISLSLVRASSSCLCLSDERNQSFCQCLYRLLILLAISGFAWGWFIFCFLAVLLRASMLGCWVAMSSWNACVSKQEDKVCHQWHYIILICYSCNLLRSTHERLAILYKYHWVYNINANSTFFLGFPNIINYKCTRVHTSCVASCCSSSAMSLGMAIASVSLIFCSASVTQFLSFSSMSWRPCSSNRAEASVSLLAPAYNYKNYNTISITNIWTYQSCSQVKGKSILSIILWRYCTDFMQVLITTIYTSHSRVII